MADGTRIFAVAGRPVLHSRSPYIFGRLFEAARLDAAYVRLAAGSGREALASAAAMGLAGLNITSPFKEETARSLGAHGSLDPFDCHEMIEKRDVSGPLETLDPDAARLGAVNCVVPTARDSGGRGFTGFNTDPAGAAGALEAAGLSAAGKEAVVVGAGGAAKAAALGLLRAGAARVTIAGRTAEKAEAAAAAVGCGWARLEELDGHVPDVGRGPLGLADILVSCVPEGKPFGLLGRLAKDAAVLDADYRDRGFLRDAERLGLRTADGLDWLVRQALPSFRLMTGIEAAPGAEALIDRDALLASTARRPNIALIGLPGAGKTTAGRKLAALLGWDFIDADASIEAVSGLSVPAFFERYGEARFRLEEKALIGISVPGAGRTVFSLGGGTILDPENLAAVRENCTVVWLWVRPSEAAARVGTGTRPLLAGGDPVRAAEALAEARTAIYARASDLVVDTGTGDADGIAERIAHEMD